MTSNRSAAYRSLVEAFLEERCVRTPGERTPASAIVRACNAFARATGQAPLSRQAVGRALSQLGVPREQAAGGTKYRVGISLLPEPIGTSEATSIRSGSDGEQRHGSGLRAFFRGEVAS